MEAALELFSEKGIRETTIKDIAKEVGVTEGALYRHFTSKDEIVLQLFGTCEENLYGRLLSAVRSEGTYKERFYTVISEFLSFCFENPSAFKYINLFHYLRSQDIKKFERLPKDALIEFIDEGIKRGIIKIRKEYALALLVGTLERLFLLVEAGVIEKREGLEEEIAQILWKALT